MLIALLLARPFIGGFESGFQTVQEYSGFVAPGIVAVFLMGFFWPRTNVAGAFAALLASIALNLVMKFGAPDIPFIIRVWLVFMGCIAASAGASLATAPPAADQPVRLGKIDFGTTSLFNTLAIVVIAILAGLYLLLW